MTYDEADRRFGTDKPDTRFGLEIEDATEATRGSEFGVFARAEAVRFLRVPQELLAERARAARGGREGVGAKGLAYLVYDEEGEVRSPIAKFLSEEELEALGGDPGRPSSSPPTPGRSTSRVLGALRLAPRPRARPDRRHGVHVPLGDRLPDVRVGRGGAALDGVHHPFTRPTDEWRERFEREPGEALAHAYDLVVNGNELGGGSFRIHEPELQAKVFDLLGLGQEEQRAKFGFLLDALAMGAPPMGGIALGIDRMTMVLAGEPNLRDVIAFPKNQAGVDPMSGAPSEVTEEQLDELGIGCVERGAATSGRV